MTFRLGSIGTQYFDANGDPLAGGKLYFYETGTSTLATTYSDQGLTTPNANPVVLTADGRLPNVFYAGDLKVVLTDASDVVIETRDPVGCCASDGALPAGGTTGQALVKASDDNFDVEWATVGGGGDWWTYNYDTTLGSAGPSGTPVSTDGTYYILINPTDAGVPYPHVIQLPASPSQGHRVGVSLANRNNGENGAIINRNGKKIAGTELTNTNYGLGVDANTPDRHVAFVYSGEDDGWVVISGALHATS